MKEDCVMRDYVLNQAIAREEIDGSLVSRVLRVFHNWRARRDIARLETFDDHMLADIGLTRGDVEWASHLPLSSNATTALESRSRRKHDFEPARRAGWGAY
jgi:uncharacterized protein YjiS (DUF1127 family)